MRLYFAIIFIALNSALGFGQEAEFHFLEKTTVKLGDFKEGEIAKHKFYFVNSGDAPLFIYAADVSCSCTKTKFTTEPIAPGDTSFFEVSFDTNGKFYWQDRVIVISSNAKKKEKLRIKLYVIPKEEEGN
ncbi:DUF1573 domain-containing protein [Lishizhenia sp.]|uniref:DUF1573 domain-containing protein n=1 Tax=Lishizhenia sp. TaxID=2497594 RepID=UPI00299D8604|nr:DUF1573 domain-containing protein [Lishizhenia sp.]